MKKVLAYTFAAVLLGVVTMLAPFALFVGEMATSKMNTEAGRSYTPLSDFDMQKTPLLTEQAYGITPAIYPVDFLFIAFMLTLSLVIALGVMRYSKRRTALRP